MKLKQLFMLLSGLALISLASLSNALAATPVRDDQQYTSRDAVRCLIGVMTSKDDVRAAYCASLSPASRRTRCTEHAMDSLANRRAWCLVEWQNKSPVRVGSLRRPSGETLRDDCDPNGPCHCPGSPIVIDIEGDGFALTDAVNGVLFDLRATRQPEQFAWTVPESDDGWLVLDRNRNGAIDNGSEMFGNYACQQLSDNPQGFIALAAFDDLAAGGNLDSMIDSNDAVYTHLRIWQDRNHDGISEPSELAALSTLGIEALSLDYSVSKLQDEHGNAFRYRAEVRGAKGSRVGPFAYDVFLVVSPATSPPTKVEPLLESWVCASRCSQEPVFGSETPELCEPRELFNVGSGPSRDTGCYDANDNCINSINEENGCQPVAFTIQCIGCSRTDPPSGCN
jgi:hypothetical protein